jgi:hypothetical protein
MLLTCMYSKRPGSGEGDENKAEEAGLVLGCGVHLEQLQLEVALPIADLCRDQLDSLPRRNE